MRRNIKNAILTIIVIFVKIAFCSNPIHQINPWLGDYFGVLDLSNNALTYTPGGYLSGGLPENETFFLKTPVNLPPPQGRVPSEWMKNCCIYVTVPPDDQCWLPSKNPLLRATVNQKKRRYYTRTSEEPSQSRKSIHCTQKSEIF